MSWRNIIKAPVPASTFAQTSVDRKQAIIEWEQKVLTPKLTQFIQQMPEGSAPSIYFVFGELAEGGAGPKTVVKPQVTWDEFRAQHKGMPTQQVSELWAKNKDKGFNIVYSRVNKFPVVSLTEEGFSEAGKKLWIDTLAELYKNEGYTVETGINKPHDMLATLSNLG